MRPARWQVGLGALLVLVVWLAVGLTSDQGALVFDADWVGRLGADSIEGRLLAHWRAPRVIAALIVGAALAVAGLVFQGLTRNPLADPYLLGIAGGAGLTVVLVRSLVPLHGLDWWLTPAAAFGGSIAAGFLVLALGRGSGGRLTVVGLVLAGLVINAMCAALMSFILARLDPFRLRVTTLWLAGGIGYASRSQLLLVGILVLLCWVYLRAGAHRLNAFLLGSEGAAGLGVDVQRVLWRATVVGCLLTALGVSLAGLLGYLGLIVPHAVRLLVGRDFRQSLPLTAMAGGLLMIVADATARLAFAPEELPAGVLTALLGCPVLLGLLRAQLRGGR